MKNNIKRIISFTLVFSIIVSFSGCFGGGTSSRKDDNLNEDILTENVLTELEFNEDVVSEFITQEIYLEEIVLAEDKISELLLEDDTVSDVLSCQTIYVSQNNIEEFSENSQAAGLFGKDVDLKPVLAKIAVGTGVIITLTAMKLANVPDVVSSVIVGAADASLKFSAGGAAIGSLFGGLTGAVDEIDETGRTSAIIGFATATAGLILAAVSAIGVVPSVGSTTITLAAGIKLVLAGVSVVAASVGTVSAGKNAIKTFKTTDSAKIDWANINWKKAGESAVKKSIKNGADGYMWGAIIGAVYGGAEGYDYYQKYNTPYSTLKARINQTPKNDEYGHWSGERGQSDYIYDKPKTIKNRNETFEVKAGTKVTYKNGVPDFSPFQKAQVKIPKMTNSRLSNFSQADEVLAKHWSKIKYDGKTWNARDVEVYRSNNGLTWHEMNNMESMQLVPKEVNGGFGHLGGVGEYNTMIGTEGVVPFD